MTSMFAGSSILFRSLLCATLCATLCASTLVADELIAEEPWAASSENVEKFSKRSSVFNYDEAKVPRFTLPDPLQTLGGTPVKSADEWMQTRRPELLELFRSQVYGHRPDVDYTVQFEELAVVEDAFDGVATGKSIKAIVAIGERTFAFPFLVFVPNDRPQPVPAVVHLNNRYAVPLDKAATEYDAFWPVKTIVERGYATATFFSSDVDPDDKDGYADGIRAFFADGAPPADDAWRSLSAWGWAGSRILDYLATLESVDSKRVSFAGHSRGGKTALWAACEDTRFAIAYSNNSGCGGAALSRRAYGETVARITSSFPHWFCKPFANYAGREQDLPIDQHEVIALIAPRGVYVASADADLWADPRGEYQALVAAAPVFRLLNVKAVEEPTMAILNQQRVVGKTGYHIRSGGHSLGATDWKLFLDFADQLLGNSPTEQRK